MAKNMFRTSSSRPIVLVVTLLFFTIIRSGSLENVLATSDRARTTIKINKDSTSNQHNSNANANAHTNTNTNSNSNANSASTRTSSSSTDSAPSFESLLNPTLKHPPAPFALPPDSLYDPSEQELEAAGTETRTTEEEAVWRDAVDPDEENQNNEDDDDDEPLMLVARVGVANQAAFDGSTNRHRATSTTNPSASPSSSFSIQVPHLSWSSLSRHCFSVTIASRYLYRFCPFHNITQGILPTPPTSAYSALPYIPSAQPKEVKVIGVWGEWGVTEEDGLYQYYDSGDELRKKGNNGEVRERSTIVIYKCAFEEELRNRTRLDLDAHLISKTKTHTKSVQQENEETDLSTPTTPSSPPSSSSSSSSSSLPSLGVISHVSELRTGQYTLFFHTPLACLHVPHEPLPELTTDRIAEERVAAPGRLNIDELIRTAKEGMGRIEGEGEGGAQQENQQEERGDGIESVRLKMQNCIHRIAALLSDASLVRSSQTGDEAEQLSALCSEFWREESQPSIDAASGPPAVDIDGLEEV